MAGLYQDFGEKRRFVIITTSVNDSMIKIHNLMPIVLQEEKRGSWLGSEESTGKLLRAKEPELIRQIAE